jgi:hypothetical protein
MVRLGTLLFCASALAAIWPQSSIAETTDRRLKKIRHVFIVVLENKGLSYTFGPGSPAPYLAHQLTHDGALLKNYYAIGHFSLDNYIAIVSGQAPNPETQGDCEKYTEFQGEPVLVKGQAIGHGCEYPSTVKTIADQLSAVNLSWKGYMEDMGNDTDREGQCGRPKLGEKLEDKTQEPQGAQELQGTLPSKRRDEYAARHNPFVYFHSLLDEPGPPCANHVVNLDALKKDIQSTDTTPNFAFIVPNLCHDGHDDPCVNGEAPGGLVSADTFLQQWVPLILNSPLFMGDSADGLLVITFDESDVDLPKDAHKVIGDTRSCCGEPRGPNIQANSTLFSDEESYRAKDAGPGVAGPGGGRIGAVLISPFIEGGTVSCEPYNHYSLLKTVETIFGLRTYLGYANQQGLRAFGADVFSGHEKCKD